MMSGERQGGRSWLSAVVDPEPVGEEKEDLAADLGLFYPAGAPNLPLV